MKYVLCSSFNNTEKDENGKRYAVKMPDIFIDIIKNITIRSDTVVFVANNPDTFEINDEFAALLFVSLELSQINFKNKIVLDSRNESDASKILKNADLIFLSGGSVECQNNFFKKIKLNEALSENNVIIGGSAGAMNMCEKTLNFPTNEDEIQKLNSNNCFLEGMDIYKRIFVPHFFGDRKIYKRGKNINAYYELLELSKNNEFIAIDNEAYILIENEHEKYFGNVYLIKNGYVEKIN